MARPTPGWRHPRFLPGEREIREAADHLRKHLSHQPALRSAEVLPLFARLSQAEQDRVFDGHTGRRIVLATNVAETSLTVPGIRYVIDVGGAREAIQPAQQGGATAGGTREPGGGQPAFGPLRARGQRHLHPPLRRGRFQRPRPLYRPGNPALLAGRRDPAHEVAAPGERGRFPAHLEAPSRRAITDGYQLLQELGAVDDNNELTPLGRELSKLPLDPRVGRMILEARTRGALDEVMVIASALSVQDVRDRPLEAQAQADQAHAKFDDDKSEFSGYLKLWKWINEARGGHGEHKLSNRQYEQLLRQNFVNIRRVRR